MELKDKNWKDGYDTGFAAGVFAYKNTPSGTERRVIKLLAKNGPWDCNKRNHLIWRGDRSKEEPKCYICDFYPTPDYFDQP